MLTPKRRSAIQRSRRKSLQAAKFTLRNSLINLSYTKEQLDKDREVWVNHNYQNRKSCSCAMCCNVRRSPFYKGSGKLTLQERKALLNQSEMLEEVYY